jgi:drug/metabolite transporter (DMT)-like permease
MTTSELKNERRAILLGICAVLLWSTVATIFKLGLGRMSAEQLLLLGSGTSWLVFSVNSILRKAFFIRRSDWHKVLLLGLINPCAYYLILFEAYDRLPAHVAQPINYTWAITLSLLAVPLLKQKISFTALMGMLISYSGVILLIATAPKESNAIEGFGILLALISTIFWAYYWIVNASFKGDPSALMFWSFTVSLPVLCVVCVAREGWPELTFLNLSLGAAVGLVEMGITFLLWQSAIRKTRNVGNISRLIFLSPFLSMIFISIFVGESISIWAIPSLLVIVVGLIIHQKSTSEYNV